MPTDFNRLVHDRCPVPGSGGIHVDSYGDGKCERCGAPCLVAGDPCGYADNCQADAWLAKLKDAHQRIAELERLISAKDDEAFALSIDQTRRALRQRDEAIEAKRCECGDDDACKFLVAASDAKLERDQALVRISELETRLSSQETEIDTLRHLVGKAKEFGPLSTDLGAGPYDVDRLTAGEKERVRKWLNDERTAVFIAALPLQNPGFGTAGDVPAVRNCPTMEFRRMRKVYGGPTYRYLAVAPDGSGIFS